MTDYTNNFSLPYPEGVDRVAVHSDVEALATRADTTFQVLHAELTEATQPRLERVSNGVYEITAPYLENVTPGVYEIGA